MKRHFTAWSLLLALALVVQAGAQTPEQPKADEPKAAQPETKAKSGAAGDPASWAPADALLFIGVTDVEQTWSDFQQTAGYKMLKASSADADAPPELNVASKMISKFQERLARTLDVPPDQLRNPFAGPLALWATAPASGKLDDVEPVLIANAGDAALLRKYYDSAVKKLSENARHEAQKAGEAVIDVFEADPAKKNADSADEDEDELPGMGPDLEGQLDKLFSPENLPDSFAATLTDGRLIVARTPEQVRALLKKAESDKALANTDDFKALGRHLKPVGSVQFLVNVPRLIEAAKASTTDADESAELRETIQTLGAEGLRSIVGHMRLGGSSYDSKIDVLFLMSGERTGLAKVLSMDNRPVAPPNTVSADAVLYTALNLNVPPLLDEIERMLRKSDPATADQFKQSLEAVPMGPEAPPVNVRKEFLDYINGPLVFTLNVARPVTPQSTSLLMALGHRDQAAIARFLSTALQAIGMGSPPRDVRGTQVFDVMFPMPPMPLSLAVASDRLLLGPGPAVEGALQGAGGSSLAESESWRQIARHAPDQAWFVMYFDQKQALDAAAALAKDGNPPQDPGAMMLMAMTGGLNQSLKPEQIRKMMRYASATIFAAATTPEGVQFTAVTLRPDAK